MNEAVAYVAIVFAAIGLCGLLTRLIVQLSRSNQPDIVQTKSGGREADAGGNPAAGRGRKR
jgi:hypothetical protein